MRNISFVYLIISVINCDKKQKEKNLLTRKKNMNKSNNIEKPDKA